MKNAKKYLLEREGNVLGTYSFDELVSMWQEGGIRETDRIRRPDQEAWTDISRIAHSFDKAKKTSGRVDSRVNLFFGGVSLLIGVGIFLWANGHSPNMGFGEMLTKSGGYVIKQPFYNTILLIACIFGIVGIIKLVRGLQSR